MNSPSPTNASQKNVLFDILAVLIILVVCVGLGEGAVRIMAANKLIYNIEMVKYAKQLKMPDPEGVASHVHRANSTARLMGVEVALNSLGNRSPELSPQKDPSRMRIMVLGSSVTMGWGVPQDGVFTALAEKQLNSEPLPLGKRVEFVNAGIGNYNTFFQYRLFQKQYPIVNPDLVVLHYFISDVEDRSQGNNNVILKYSYLADLLYDMTSKFLFKFSGTKDLAKYYENLYADSNAQWSKTMGYIGEIRDTLAKNRVPLMVMIVPDIHNLGTQSTYKLIYEKIEKDLSQHGILTYNMFDDLSSDFAGRERDLWIQADDPHPNAMGHEEMAKLLVRFLTQQLPQAQKQAAKGAK